MQILTPKLRNYFDKEIVDTQPQVPADSNRRVSNKQQVFLTPDPTITPDNPLNPFYDNVNKIWIIDASLMEPLINTDSTLPADGFRYQGLGNTNWNQVTTDDSGNPITTNSRLAFILDDPDGVIRNYILSQILYGTDYTVLAVYEAMPLNISNGNQYYLAIPGGIPLRNDFNSIKQFDWMSDLQIQDFTSFYDTPYSVAGGVNFDQHLTIVTGGHTYHENTPDWDTEDPFNLDNPDPSLNPMSRQDQKLAISTNTRKAYVQGLNLGDNCSAS